MIQNWILQMHNFTVESYRNDGGGSTEKRGGQELREEWGKEEGGKL